ncbi:hypothetical protein Syun_025697 [Stephania yunnanensis]|uniref:Uncharacterized protein n=1 Tax=Stephania yunnanensis TaxID=152371 RepID=A0AAP0HV27_9MAGN
MDALQLMRNDMIPTEVDVSTSRRDDVSWVGIIIDSESDEDVEVMDYSSDENEFMSNDDDNMAPGSQQGTNRASRNSSNVNSGGNVPSQTASATNSHVFDKISSQVVTDPTATLNNTVGCIAFAKYCFTFSPSLRLMAINRNVKTKVLNDCVELVVIIALAAPDLLNSLKSYSGVDKLKKGRRKAKNVALYQYLAKSNGIKPKVNIHDGKLKPVGPWAAEFTTKLGIICRTYAPIQVAQLKKVEQKDKEQIYNLIREEMIEIQSQPSPMTEDEIYKEVMDKKLGYARGRGYGEIG